MIPGTAEGDAEMNHVRSTVGAIAVFLTTAALLTGCATTEHSAPRVNAPVAASALTAIPAGFSRPASGGAGGGGTAGGGTATPAPSLPASWPRDVPVPAGKLIGSTSSTGRWTVLLVQPGSAATVLHLAGAFYKAAGFSAASASVLNRGTRHITLVVENRDHSATKTNLVIQLTTP
jgi:hypothetical protein